MYIEQLIIKLKENDFKKIFPNNKKHAEKLVYKSGFYDNFQDNLNVLIDDTVFESKERYTHEELSQLQDDLCELYDIIQRRNTRTNEVLVTSLDYCNIC